MASSYTTNKTLEKPGNGDYVDTWNVPVNSDMDVIDQAFGGVTSINVTAAAGTIALTASQYRSLIIAFSGTLTANVNYQVPAGVGGQWVVSNNSTGAFTITISSAGGGSSFVVAQGIRAVIVSDGTNIISPSATIPAGTITTAMLTDSIITYPKLDSTALASGADLRADVPSKILPTSSVWDAAEYVALTDAASIAVDMSAGFNFSVTISASRTLANPTNAKPGQSGIITVTEGGAGGWSLSFGSSYKFANGTTPTLDTVAGRINVLAYSVVSSSFIVVSLLKGVR